MASIPEELDDYWLDNLDNLTTSLLDEYDGLGGVGSVFTPGTSPRFGGLTAQQHVTGVPKRDFSANESQTTGSSSVAESAQKLRPDVSQGKASDGDTAGTSIDNAQKSFSINKATREKLRRERLNERFSELAALLNLKGPNVDKLRVLSEAINVLKSLREEMTQLKNTNNRLHLANTMTSEMAVSLLKVRREGDKPNGKITAVDLGKEDTFQDPVQPISTFQADGQMTNQVMEVQQLQNDMYLRNDTKRKRFETENNVEMPQMFANAPNKLANMSSLGWPINAFPPNMAMNMWMPASAQDISQDHLLRPPVA